MGSVEWNQWMKLIKETSGTVRELASTEGLAPLDGDILPDPPDGSVVTAVTTEENVGKEIMSSHSGSSGGPDGLPPSWQPSFPGCSWLGGKDRAFYPH